MHRGIMCSITKRKLRDNNEDFCHSKDKTIKMWNCCCHVVHGLKAQILLVSGIAGVGEHLNVVPRLHHVMADKRVDDRSLDHICQHNEDLRESSRMFPSPLLS